MTHPQRSSEMERLKQLVYDWRQQGETIVFTNGCFDVLHQGHQLLLDRARQLGGRLIVAVNSDEYCRRVKGLNRPVQPCLQRCQAVRTASQADCVVELSQNDPGDLLCALRPDFYVLGSDYRDTDLPGRQFCRHVMFVERLPGISTTELLKKSPEIVCQISGP